MPFLFRQMGSTGLLVSSRAFHPIMPVETSRSSNMITCFAFDSKGILFRLKQVTEERQLIPQRLNRQFVKKTTKLAVVLPDGSLYELSSKISPESRGMLRHTSLASVKVDRHREGGSTVSLVAAEAHSVANSLPWKLGTRERLLAFVPGTGETLSARDFSEHSASEIASSRAVPENALAEQYNFARAFTQGFSISVARIERPFWPNWEVGYGTVATNHSFRQSAGACIECVSALTWAKPLTVLRPGKRQTPLNECAFRTKSCGRFGPHGRTRNDGSLKGHIRQHGLPTSRCSPKKTRPPHWPS